jgi:hypothetical protein
MLNVDFFIAMLNVIILVSVIMLNVSAEECRGAHKISLSSCYVAVPPVMYLEAY